MIKTQVSQIGVEYRRFVVATGVQTGSIARHTPNENYSQVEQMNGTIDRVKDNLRKQIIRAPVKLMCNSTRFEVLEEEGTSG